jgi:hypothetical protein
MPQPRFDRLTERLLTAGIAPRHVRRYARELSDHYDDLVREEMEAGAGRELAESRARSRLGNDEDLAEAMLARPELRSLAARYPWAVFGLGPILLLALSVVGAVYLEVWLLDQTGFVFRLFGMQPSLATARKATMIYTVYNTLVVFGGPLLFAWLLYWIGARQRMRPAWIVTGVALVCVLGGFQNLVFYDTGCRGCGHLLMSSALIPPFPHFAEGLTRAVMNLAIAGGVWWLATRRKLSPGIALSHTAET